MIIGIDVGGTFTDGVLFDQGNIIATAKKPTEINNLQNSLLQVLDDLLQKTDKSTINRIVLSTTLVTNIIATGRGEKTALVLMSGHGLPHNSYSIGENVFFIKGSIDFRGKEIEAPDKDEIMEVAQRIRDLGIKKLAVVGKFSHRNNCHEKLVKQLLQQACPDFNIFLGSEIAGRLNFPRRAATTYYTAMTADAWNSFTREIEAALQARQLTAAVHILKADGGTIGLKYSKDKPCETVFSGPAASTMGGLALTMDSRNSVVMDIGGTTTDISLIMSGQPLYASKGASLNGHYTHINSFAVRSIPLGGDSELWLDDGTINIGPQRVGVAACFGGTRPTVTDAFNYTLGLGIGNAAASEAMLAELAQETDKDVVKLGELVVEQVVDNMMDLITQMFTEWENEPAYKIWEVINRRKFNLDRIIGIGAAAEVIIPLVARKMNVEYLISKYSPVANALGASVVRPTLAVELHVDTQNRIYTVSPGGTQEKLENAYKFQLNDAKLLAEKHLQKISRERDMEEYANQSTFYLEEQFNLIRGWERAGKIFEVGLQVAPGFIKEYEGVRA